MNPTLLLVIGIGLGSFRNLGLSGKAVDEGRILESALGTCRFDHSFRCCDLLDDQAQTLRAMNRQPCGFRQRRNSVSGHIGGLRRAVPETPRWA